MKKNVLNLLFTFIILFPFTISAVVVRVQHNMLKSTNKTAKAKKFKRLYSDFRVQRNTNTLKKDSDISITFEDFSQHLEVGRNRILSGVFAPITMDIGSINSGTKETWVLPDFSKNSDYVSTTLQQLDAEETDLHDEFGYGSHIIYSEALNVYELYDLTDFDFYFVGSKELEDGVWELYEYEQTKSPTPLELGIEYTSEVAFESDTDGTYTEYTDTFNVVGQGTLKTFDDGDADAMKMIYKEEIREFVNGEEVSYEERYEIVFYSKKGHYVTAEISDPWNSEGEVTLTNVNYQKLESKTATVIDGEITNVKTFPNPIKAGQTLTLESQISLKEYDVAIYNVNGQKVGNLNFYTSNNNQYQVKLPDNLSRGLYFYKVQNKKGSVLKNGKIQIQ